MNKRTIAYRVFETSPMDYELTLEDLEKLYIRKYTHGGINYLVMHTSGGFTRWVIITRHFTTTNIKMGVKALTDKKIIAMIENFLGGNTTGVEILTEEEFQEIWEGIQKSYFGRTDLTEFGIYLT